MKKRVVSLFSGVGGLDLGFEQAGYQVELLCEKDGFAQAVLGEQFTDVNIESDICDLKSLPEVDVVTAGFPCQDLSQAGRKAGISGSESGLVSNLFRLLALYETKKAPTVVIENVPYMLRLNRGEAMRALIRSFEELGYKWAYRIVDARAFGVPQRRPRLIMVAAQEFHPKDILFDRESIPAFKDPRPGVVDESAAYGFYWTEGSRGVGWTLEGVPPIKGGSSVGIPSSPAVWIPAADFAGTLDVYDAERIQGFPGDWTRAVVTSAGGRNSLRWKLIGNAVVPAVSKWLADRLAKDHETIVTGNEISSQPLPAAGYGMDGKIYSVDASTYPVQSQAPKLRNFLAKPLKPLSVKATQGFLRRTEVCTNVNYAPRFIASLKAHVNKTRNPNARSAA